MNQRKDITPALFSLITEDRELIIYRKTLNKITGSVLSTILLQQVIYWYQKMGKDKFFKFRAPCEHPRYQKSDSWTEELGFSKDEFDTALKMIGTKITRGVSKNEVLARTDVKSLILYWTDSNHLTWYILNSDLLDKLAFPIYLENGDSLFISNTETTAETNTHTITPAEGVGIDKWENEHLQNKKDLTTTQTDSYFEGKSTTPPNESRGWLGKVKEVLGKIPDGFLSEEEDDIFGIGCLDSELEVTRIFFPTADENLIQDTLRRTIGTIKKRGNQHDYPRRWEVLAHFWNTLANKMKEDEGLKQYNFARSC